MSNKIYVSCIRFLLRLRGNPSSKYVSVDLISRNNWSIRRSIICHQQRHLLFYYLRLLLSTRKTFLEIRLGSFSHCNAGKIECFLKYQLRIQRGRMHIQTQTENALQSMRSENSLPIDIIIIVDKEAWLEKNPRSPLKMFHLLWIILENKILFYHTFFVSYIVHC